MDQLRKLAESYQWVDKISNKTIIEIVKINDILTELHARFFKQYDISNTRFNVLVILYKGPEDGMCLSDIGEQMLVSNANITGLIDRLERQNLVTRVRDEKDRRKVIAKISTLGKETIEDIIKKYIFWSNSLMSVLENAEKSQLFTYLKKLEQGIIEMQPNNTLNTNFIQTERRIK